MRWISTRILCGIAGLTVGAVILPLQAQVIIDPIALRNVQASVCYAEAFDEPARAVEFGGASVPGFAGAAIAMKGAKAPLTFPSSLLNPSAGTISWWARYDFAAQITVPVLGLDGGGPLYINFFGDHGSTDIRHKNCLGHYFNSLGGPVFAVYPVGIPSNQWTHFAFTWNGNQTTFYVNGYISSGQTTAKPFSALKVTSFSLGGIGEYVFDEVRLYNRALSHAEIQGYAAAARSGEAAVRQMALAAPAQLAARQAASVRAVYRLSDHTVLAYSDLQAAGFTNRVDVRVAVTGPKNDTVLTQEFKAVDPARLFCASLPAGRPLDPGLYRVAMTLGTNTLVTSFERVREVWESNRIGVTNGVIDPWMPLSVRRRAATCWGRTYTFSPLGLPEQILSTQPEPSRGPATCDLLVNPVRLVVETAAGSVSWRGGKPAVQSRNDGYVDVTGSAVSRDKQFTVSTRGTLEYDGFYKFSLRLDGPPAVTVQSVRLEVTLPDALACLVNAATDNMRSTKVFLNVEGAADGELWNSTTRSPKRDIPGGFYPHVWLGNDDRGIAFLADSTRGWVIDPQKPCQDIIRTNGQTILRIHLLNQPGPLSGPIETTLSLQATPIRPRPPGGSWKSVEWYGWGYFDKPVLYQGCFDGIGTNGLAPEAWYRSEEARQNNRWWRYFCGQSFRTPFDDPDYGRMLQRYSDEWAAGLYVPSHRDYLMWAYQQWHDRASMDGIYYDNTFPQVAPDLSSGLAWVDPDGQVRPSHNVFGAREFMKRVRTYFTQVGPSPVLKAHITDAPVVGYLGFCDFWLDGENGGYLTATQELRAAEGQAFDFVDRWYSPIGLANLRVTLGRMWGVMPKYLYSWGADPTFAMLGMFDLENNYWTLNSMKYDFGLKAPDCEYIPYWDVRALATIVKGGPDVFATVWKRPGQARILVSNLSPESRAVDVRLDAAKLGLPAGAIATDEQTGETVALNKGILASLPVERHNYRMVLVAAPDRFPPVPTAVPALAPGQRIAGLCDDFATLRPEWTVLPTNKAATILRGMLELSEVPHVISRPFNEDNCSVQVKIRACAGLNATARGGFWEGGPSLFLSWSTNTCVQIQAGHEYPMPGGNRVRTYAMSAGKSIPIQCPEVIENTVVWVRVTLKADAIAFFCSTDGQAWLPLGTLPRKGFEGAPARLILGNGCMGPNPDFANTGRAWGAASFFDDLITGRE